jgi:hypothetical protein
MNECGVVMGLEAATDRDDKVAPHFHFELALLYALMFGKCSRAVPLKHGQPYDADKMALS